MLTHYVSDGWRNKWRFLVLVAIFCLSSMPLMVSAQESGAKVVANPGGHWITVDAKGGRFDVSTVIANNTTESVKLAIRQSHIEKVGDKCFTGDSAWLTLKNPDSNTISPLASQSVEFLVSIPKNLEVGNYDVYCQGNDKDVYQIIVEVDRSSGNKGMPAWAVVVIVVGAGGIGIVLFLWYRSR